MALSDYVVPHRKISSSALFWLVVVEAIAACALWSTSRNPFFPTPTEVVRALYGLWQKEGLLFELYASLRLSVVSMFVAGLFAIVLAYAAPIALFRPVVSGLSKFRFLSLVGWQFFIGQATGGGERQKVWMMVIGMSVFFLTGFASVIDGVSRDALNHARVVRMSPWRVVWEEVILGTRGKTLDVLRQNAAIGWSMLTMVEGLIRTNGGLGVLIRNHDKYMDFAPVFALQFVVLVIGLLQDFFLGALIKWVAPFEAMRMARSAS